MAQNPKDSMEILCVPFELYVFVCLNGFKIPKRVFQPDPVHLHKKGDFYSLLRVVCSKRNIFFMKDVTHSSFENSTAVSSSEWVAFFNTTQFLQSEKGVLHSRAQQYV